MTINEHVQELEGLTVWGYSADDGIPSSRNVALRLSIDWDQHERGENFDGLFASMLADPAAGQLEALLIGDWGGAGEGNDSAPVVEALVAAREQLPNLRALFLGEMIYEESEISWINQSDVSPLFSAYPNLEVFYVRGGNGLSLGRPQHENLRKLVIQTGGLASEVVREVASADLPALEHLELWLGDEGYGRTVTRDDIRELLESGPVAKLQYLGLRDDAGADDTAVLLAEIGIPETVKILDLSLGTLGDEGATALATSKWIGSLEKLDIHFHYVSAGLVETLTSVVAELDASDHQEPDEYDGESYRYVQVSE